MTAWLVPLSVFPLVAALFLGGGPIRIRGGGGVRQTVGLILTLALYLAAWAGLRAVLGGSTGGVVIATVVAAVLIPAGAWLGFRVVGVRLEPTGWPDTESGH